MEIKFKLLIAIFYFNVWVSNAYAVSCGDLIDRYVRLEEDLHCNYTGTEHRAALIITANNVTVDLNGYGIYQNSPTSHLNTAVVADNIRGLRVIGHGGKIENFRHGIKLNGGNNIHVSGITFYDNGTAINFGPTTDSDQAKYFFIYKNTFIGNEVGIDTFMDTSIKYVETIRDRNSHHSIWKNDFYSNRKGISMYRTQQTSIVQNNFLNHFYSGIAITSSTDLEVKGNKIHNLGQKSGIILRNSSYVEISNNHIDYHQIGIRINNQSTEVARLDESEFNHIHSNYIINNEIGIKLGWHHPRIGFTVRKNLIEVNKIYSNEMGIEFLEDTSSNSAFRNGFHNTAVPIIDLGLGNSH